MIVQLVQLLLKSSQDKRFVCEAAEKALVAMTTWVSPILLLPKLQPYLKNRNPRIRAKASMCFSRSVPRLVRQKLLHSPSLFFLFIEKLMHFACVNECLLLCSTLFIAMIKPKGILIRSLGCEVIFSSALFLSSPS